MSRLVYSNSPRGEGQLLKASALRLPRSGHVPRPSEERAGPGPVARGGALAQVAVEIVVPQLARAALAPAAHRIVASDPVDAGMSAEHEQVRLELHRSEQPGRHLAGEPD